jgi:hypothetical protein
LWLPVAVAVDGSDNLYIADEGNQRVRKVGTDGIISTVAGSGVEGYSGDNGPAIAAGLYYPDGVAVDGYGDIFISDYFTNRIRRVAPNGIITTLAGNGTAGETGDGGAAASAELDGPAGLGLDGAGNVFVCDSGSNRVREIVLSGVLTLPGVTLSEGGSYQVVIRSPSGSVTSQVATLTVAAPPVVIIQPASQDILAGGNVTFSVSAAGSPPLSYAWLSNSTAVAGATNTAYSDNGVQLTDSGSQFVCVVTNVYGSVTSSVATLTVGVPPLFSVPPSNQTAPLGGSVTFTATNSGTGPLAYQWVMNGTNLVDFITTVAGDGGYGFSGNGVPATNASLYYPYAIAVDATGNLFIADTDDQRIRKVDTNGIITTVAGDGGYGYNGDNVPATNTSLYSPEGVAVDAFGNLFIGDTDNYRIRKVGTNGIITTVAGNGTYGFSGDGGPATGASLEYPAGVAVDAFGNLFIADEYNQRIRKVGTSGIITTFAGNGNYDYSGDGGPATKASFRYPTGVAMDANGNLFISDYSNSRIRKVDTNGMITTVAGDQNSGFTGDGVLATNTSLYNPYGVAVDAWGDLFIADEYNQRIRKVSANGIITTLAGNGSAGYSGDGGLAVNASLDDPMGVAADAFGNVFLSDYGNQRIRQILSPATLTLTNLSVTNAGSYQLVVTSPYGSVTSSVATLTLLLPPSISIQPASQSVLVGSNATFSVSAAGTAPLIYQWYGSSGAIGAATNSSYTTNDVPSAASGSQFVCVVTNLYGSVTSAVATLTVGLPPGITAQPTNQVALIGSSTAIGLTLSGTGPFTYQWQFNGTNVPTNIITTLAGDGTGKFSGDGGIATNAGLDGPEGVTVDALGNVFIADTDNQRVRRVDTNKIITTVAGNGSYGYAGDGGSAIIEARLYYPEGVAVDADGNLFIADYDNLRVRKVATNGVITTVAGDGGYGYNEDNVPATNASLYYPTGVAVDVSGNVFIADQSNQRIRKVDTNGIITTVAGSANYGFAGDGGAATNARLYNPRSVAVDASGNLFIADTDNERIRKVDTNGIITTVAGNGTNGFSGDGVPATRASLSSPVGVAVDAFGNLFIADTDNLRVRKVGANGIIATVAGDGDYGFSGDNVPATSASVYFPYGVAVDASGNLFIADTSNERIRQVLPAGAGAVLDLNTVASSNAGSYQVIVTSPYGSVTSAVATLTIVYPPTITEEAASQYAAVGSNATFSVAAGGTPPLAYAWYCNGKAIAGATSSAYTTNSVQLANSGSLFDCVITNLYGRVTSDTATLIVGTPPSLLTQPTNQTLIEGKAVTFGLAVAGSGPFTYEWQCDGTNLPSGLIYTVAGGGGYGYSGDGGSATNAKMEYPESVAVDASGNLFIVDTDNERIRKVATDGTITTLAGDGLEGYSGDGVAATNTSLDSPGGVAVDAFGNVFIADYYNERIRKVDTNGIITTVAGDGGYGFYGDGGAATNATLYYPTAVAVDGRGNLFVADEYNQRIRKVDTSGIITTVAGNGTYGFSGDGGAATNAKLSYPRGVAVDASGNVFIADTDNERIRMVDTNGIITTAAGDGAYNDTGDGGPAIDASFRVVEGVAVDGLGNFFIADAESSDIRKVDFRGIITAVAGIGGYGFSGDGGAATQASLDYPYGVAADGSGDVFIADTDNQRIREVVPYGAAPTLLLENVGSNNAGSYRVIVTTPFGSVTSQVATLTVLLRPSVVVQPVSQDIPAGGGVTFNVTATGTAPLAYAWYRNGRAIAGATGTSYTTNDVRLTDTGNTFDCVISNAYGIVASDVATVTVGLPPAITKQPANQTAQPGNDANFALTLSGTGPLTYQWLFNGTNLPFGLIYTVAGNGVFDFTGDGGPATNATLDYPESVAVDASGNLFIADTDNERIRKVDTNGIITTIAGDGTYGYSGDGAAATNASFRYPVGVLLDASGNLLISDFYNERVRKVDTNGIITTVAGDGTGGYYGDGGAATNCELDGPYGLAMDTSGNLFIADSWNDVIRKVDTNGIITTVAGDGSENYTGDGGPATKATLDYPVGVAVDASGNLFIADSGNYVVRKVDADGTITTAAGNGYEGYSGDGGPATSASMTEPLAVAVDAAGDLFIADKDNNRIRMMDAAGIITTVAGVGFEGYTGDGGFSTSASFYYPEGVTVDGHGNLFIADSDNDVVREVVPLGVAPMLSLTDVSASDAGTYQVIISSPFGSVTSSVITLTIVSGPVISSAVRNANGSVTLNLQTVPGAASRVFAATNLAPPVLWRPVYTNSNVGSNGQWQFTDTNTASYRTRFFRASTP